MIQRARLSRTTVYVLVAAVILLLGGFAVWQLHAPTLKNIADQIETSQDNMTSYQQLIAKRNVFRREYTKLADTYLSHQATPTSVEAQFTDVLANVAQRDHVQFVGITYGTVNGNNPPPPDPHIDANGQPIHAPTTVDLPPPDAITNLGGRNPGDPQFGRPNISTDLFTRIPAGVTFKGDWRDLLEALQDISKQNVLMSVARPEIRRLNGSVLVASFNVQLLTPAINVVPELLDPAMQKKMMKNPRPPRHGIRKVSHVRHHLNKGATA